MDTEEAKRILEGIHPETASGPVPPELEAARAQAAADPELGAWLRAEHAFDRSVSRALRSVDAPAGLKASILDPPPPAKIRRKRLAPLLFATAALLLAASGLVKFFFFPPEIVFPRSGFSAAAAFRDDMAYFCTRRFLLDYQTRDLAEAREWLAAREHPVYSEIPRQIVRFQGLGCKAIDWGAHKVGLVCFRDDNREVVHLFIISAAAFADPAEAGASIDRILVEHGLHTAGWRDDEHLYCLVGSEPGVEVAHLLP